MEKEKVQELIKFLEKEIAKELKTYENNTDMGSYHLGYADALRSIKWVLEGMRKVQF